MTDEIYKNLQCFPKDKSYLSHLQLQEKLDPNGIDFNTLLAKCEPLHNAGFVEGQIHYLGLRITDKGLEALKEYEKQKGFWFILYEKKWWIFWGTVIIIILSVLALLL